MTNTAIATDAIFTDHLGRRAIDRDTGRELPFESAQKAADNPLIWTWVVWK